MSCSSLGISPEKAIKLAVNDYSREFWSDRLHVSEDSLPLQYGMIAGATAGVCQVIVTNPMEIVKINMQMAGVNAAPGIPRPNTMDVVRDLGLKGLYRGTLATLSRDVPFSFLFFPSLSLFKSMAPKNPDGTVPFSSVFGSGIVAGAFSAAAVTPMDVVKTRLQVSGKPGEKPYKNMSECYRYGSFFVHE